MVNEDSRGYGSAYTLRISKDGQWTIYAQGKEGSVTWSPTIADLKVFDKCLDAALEIKASQEPEDILQD